ncbi:MFS transporter [Streptomyces sp. NPDC058247]|uniref:MFS transporter n=1 Tax=Streptomyces sp. NPDC058247 TaxID=3346401 RepID=UPI0036EE253A
MSITVAPAVEAAPIPVRLPFPTPARHRWPATVWALLGGTFLVRAGGFAYPFLSIHLAHARFAPGAISLVLAVFGVGWLVGQIVTGWAADRFGRRTTLIAAMLLAAIVLPPLAYTHGVLAVSAGALVAGAVYDAPRPIVSAVIADVIADEEGRARVSGWRHFAVNVGAALTGSVGGVVADAHGTVPLFWANAAICLLVAVLAAWFVKNTRPEGRAARGAYRQALADERLWLLWLASVCALICCAGLFSALPMLMAEDGLSATAYGWTQVASAVAVVVLTPFLAPWLSRRAAGTQPMVGLLAISALILGAGMSAAGLVSTPLGYCLAAAAAVPGEIILFVAAGDVLNRISPAHARGLYAGLWGSTLAVAVILAPLLAGWSLAHGGDHMAAATTAGAGLLGAALCLPLAALVHRPAPAAS